METIETVKNLFFKLGELGINYQIVLMVLLGGLFAQTYCSKLNQIGPVKIDAAWRTLMVGSAFVFVLIAVKSLQGPLPKDIWEEYFISYVFSTSLYELMLKKLLNKLLIKLGLIEEPKQPTTPSNP